MIWLLAESLFQKLFTYPTAKEIGEYTVIEDFENMVYPQSIDPKGTEQLFLVDTKYPSQGWVVAQGPRDAKKWVVSVARPGYKSPQCIKYEWDNRNGVWLSAGVWLEPAKQFLGAEQLSFYVKVSRPAKFDVTINVQTPLGTSVPFWTQTQKIYETNKWVQVIVPFYKMTVPRWYLKQVGGKPYFKRIPENPTIRAVVIAPVWSSFGVAYIDDVAVSPSTMGPPPKIIARKKTPWEKVRSFVTFYGYALPAEFSGSDPNKPYFELAIIESRQYSREEIEEMKKAGIWVVGYVTIGEDDQLHKGDGLGPGGYASYYMDIDQDGMPDMNPNWKSYYVNAGSPLWQKIIIEQKVKEIVEEKGCDGIFMDTVDTVDIYPDTYDGMVDLIKNIRKAYPNIKIVQNRGFTVLPDTAQYIDAVMFEDFSIHYDWQEDRYAKLDDSLLAQQAKLVMDVLIPVQKKMAEQGRTLHVVVLDYAEPYQKDLIGFCYERAWNYGFIPYVSTIMLDEIYHYDFIKVEGDRLTWTDSQGNQHVAVWGKWRDGSEPVYQKYLASLGSSAGSSGKSAYKDKILHIPDNLAAAENGAKIYVDSVFPGYGKKEVVAQNLNDGLRNIEGLFWRDAAWASLEFKLDHWIEVEFFQSNPSNPQPRPVREVRIYWALDNGQYWSSTHYEIQIWDDKARKWVTVKVVDNPDSHRKFDRIVLDKTYYTTKIRIFQPKGGGPKERPNIMWVAEVEVYSEPKPEDYPER